MSFMDDLRRSLGFEENQNNRSNQNTRSSSYNNHADLSRGGSNQFYNSSGYDSNYNSYEDDFSITPEQDVYDIILSKPLDTDDMDYVFDQVVEENNTVIVDLSKLAKAQNGDFRTAGQMLSSLRKDYGAEAILLERNKNRIMILITPKRVNVIKK